MVEQQEGHRDHTHAVDVAESAKQTRGPGHTPGKAEGPDDPEVEKAHGTRTDDRTPDPGRTPGNAEG